MPENRLDFAGRRVASLAYSMLFAASALWLSLGEFVRYQGHLSDGYQIAARTTVVAAILLLISLAVKYGWWSRAPASIGIVWLASWIVVDLGLLAMCLWTWLRGAASRLLLAGGGDLLAIVTVVLVLQAAWHALDVRPLLKPSAADPSHSPRTASHRLVETLALCAVLLLLLAWFWLELLGLPHVSRADMLECGWPPVSSFVGQGSALR